MLYIDENLPRHPKILRAAVLLGDHGRARALAIVLDAISYARTYLTDGQISREVVAAFPLDPAPLEVADALVEVRLWHRTKRGFRIHDFHDWNKTADEVRETREKWKNKKRGQRKKNSRGDGGQSALSPTLSPTCPPVDSRARARYHVPRTTYVQDHAAVAADISTSVENRVENRRVLRALIWREVEAAFDDPAESWDLASLAERCKTVAARAGLDYGGPWFRDVVEVAAARVERRARKAVA